MDVSTLDLAISQRAQLRSDLPQSPAQAAREFEALLLAQMFKVMRESIETSGLFEEMPGGDIYLELMDQEVARALVQKGGIGISALLEQFLSGKSGIATSGPSKSPAGLQKDFVPTASLRHSEGEKHLDQPGADAMTLRDLIERGAFQLSSNIGWRRDPISGELHYHSGVDLAAAEGTRVSSLTEGKVVFSGRNGGYGNLVEIENDQGFRFRYAHLSRLDVQAGDRVAPGQEIGRVGSTGRATGPHLHLEIEREGKLIAPLRGNFTYTGQLPREIPLKQETVRSIRGE